MLVVVVRNGVREILNHSLRVLFCIASPSHCVCGQILIDKSVIRNIWSTAAPRVKKCWSTQQQNCIPHPNCFFFFTRFFGLTILGSPSSCLCFVGTQERVLRPLDLSHSGPKHHFLNHLSRTTCGLCVVSEQSIFFTEPAPVPISPANGGMKRSL